jgi:hypothetical protein
MDVSAPFGAMLNTVMFAALGFPASKNWASGVTLNEMLLERPAPVGNGEPGTDVRTPVAGLMENALTVSLKLLATYR